MDSHPPEPEHAHQHTGPERPAPPRPKDGESMQDFWDDRYREQDQIWSGNVNPQLEAEVYTLSFDGDHTALDVGCGEGGDVLWLAQKGWQATGIDLSSVAVERARAKAAELGLSENASFAQQDLTTWTPTETYDLVSAQFLHSPNFGWVAALAKCAQAVAVDGTLLIVGHLLDDVKHVHEDAEEMMWNPKDLAEVLSLSPPQWRIDVAEVRDRTVGHVGENGHTRDAVFRATRLQ